jgi:hypothetical protein
MVDLKALQSELQHARRSRIAAVLAAEDMEEQAEQIRQTPPAGLWPRFTRRLVGPRLFVFAN